MISTLENKDGQRRRKSSGKFIPAWEVVHQHLTHPCFTVLLSLSLFFPLIFLDSKSLMFSVQEIKLSSQLLSSGWALSLLLLQKSLSRKQAGKRMKDDLPSLKRWTSAVRNDANYKNYRVDDVSFLLSIFLIFYDSKKCIESIFPLLEKWVEESRASFITVSDNSISNPVQWL